MKKILALLLIFMILLTESALTVTICMFANVNNYNCNIEKSCTLKDLTGELNWGEGLTMFVLYKTEQIFSDNSKTEQILSQKIKPLSKKEAMIPELFVNKNNSILQINNYEDTNCICHLCIFYYSDKYYCLYNDNEQDFLAEVLLDEELSESVDFNPNAPTDSDRGIVIIPKSRAFTWKHKTEIVICSILLIAIQIGLGILVIKKKALH